MPTSYALSHNQFFCFSTFFSSHNFGTSDPTVCPIYTQWPINISICPQLAHSVPIVNSQLVQYAHSDRTVCPICPVFPHWPYSMPNIPVATPQYAQYTHSDQTIFSICLQVAHSTPIMLIVIPHYVQYTHSDSTVYPIYPDDSPEIQI